MIKFTKFSFFVLFAVLTSVNIFAINYSISFTASGLSTSLDSVVVRNLTKGTSVTLTSGGVLNLNDEPNAVEVVKTDNENIIISKDANQNFANAKFYVNKSGKTQINIYSVDGKSIINKSFDLVEGANTLRFSTPKGCYILSIKGNSGSYSAKFISDFSAKTANLDLVEIAVPTQSVRQKAKSEAIKLVYNQGDKLLFKAKSGSNVAFSTEIPTISKTMNFEFKAGVIAWEKNSTRTLKNHFIVPEGTSLYVEEGAKIIMDEINIRPEIIILGNLYCYGRSSNPILFTIAEQYRTEAQRFDRYWGGIICGYKSKEVLLDNVTIEYGGAQTTEESESFKHSLFKTVTGEGVPAFHFCNLDGKFVMQNCTLRNNAEDQIYITGGKSIVMNNKFIASGFDGGEAINYKSGCLADIAYNMIYDANSNGFKLSNNGALEPQAHLYVYNNSVINSGWRRPKVKGGSVWLEMNVYAELYNNMLFDCRWCVKRDAANVEDTRSVISPNYLFASTATGVTQYQADAAKGQLVGANDKVSTTAGDKNPLFSNFTIQTTVDINAGTTKSGNIPQVYNSAWDFRLGAGSPALTGGKTDFTRHFGTTGITIDGVEYKSPAPAAYFGAFGAK